MYIKDILSGGKISLSCEMFPPKRGGAEMEQTKRTAEQIAALKPAFMSVTYGATGGTSAHTIDMAAHLDAYGVPTVAHLTCASSTKDEIHTMLERFKSAGIENILALRGDIPEGEEFPHPQQYQYAHELISEIKAFGGFCIGGACYPEGHPECEHKADDLRYLKQKVDCGLDFLVSQMFFDNNVFYNFLYRALAQEIRVPIIPGIMPVTNGKQIMRICKLSGASVPMRFRMIVDRFGDDPAAMQQAGIAYATEQIIDLFANGVNAVHVYTMNKPEIAAAIFRNLSNIIGR